MLGKGNKMVEEIPKENKNNRKVFPKEEAPTVIDMHVDKTTLPDNKEMVKDIITDTAKTVIQKQNPDKKYDEETLTEISKKIAHEILKVFEEIPEKEPEQKPQQVEIPKEEPMKKTVRNIFGFTR